MKILCIDTTSNVCSVAILEYDTLLCELSNTNMKTHSENLMPLIDKAFKQSNTTLEDISAIACDIGPRFFYRNSYRNCNCKSYGRSLPVFQ